MPDDDGTVGVDLLEYAFVRVVGSVRAVHHEDPPPTQHELEHLERIAEAVRPPPPGQAIRLREGGEHRIGRGGNPSLRAERRTCCRVVRMDHCGFSCFYCRTTSSHAGGAV